MGRGAEIVVRLTPPANGTKEIEMEVCPSCGDLASFGVSEVYPELRELVLDACCDENLSGWIAEIASWSRKRRVQWMLSETGLLVREIVLTDDVLSWTLDYGLQLEPVDFATARDFIRDHHRHCAPPVGWKYGAAVFNGLERIGVVTAGRPVSAELARQGCIEVNRVCVRDTQPHTLVENACSMLYGYACREAFRRGCSRVVTYTLASERGISLRAAGFVPVARSEGETWNRAGRPRSGGGSTAPKLRWERWKDQRSVAVQTRLPLAA